MRCGDRSRSVYASAAAGNASEMVPNSEVVQCILVCSWSPPRRLRRRKRCVVNVRGVSTNHRKDRSGLTVRQMDGGCEL